MAERPILFSGPMVRAILAGTKTQTRRIVKPQPPATMTREVYFSMQQEWCFTGPQRDTEGNELPIDKWKGGWPECGENFSCPYGKIGDRLWVRESTVVHASIREQLCGYRAAGCNATEAFEKNMPSIHMRRAHCRIILEITAVRVQRLQDITEEDAKAEGAQGGCENCGETPCHPGCVGHKPNFRDGFAHIWMKINGEASWHANPWVWAITFKHL